MQKMMKMRQYIANPSYLCTLKFTRLIMIQQENKAKFYVDEQKCTGCGRCVNVCSGQVLSMVDGVPEIKDFDRFGWGGCWKCQHCLAVCPEGAISILGKCPQDSLPRPDATMGEQMDRLVANRPSCRRYPITALSLTN
jgi:ferredoxin